ncbi:MAG: cupin domain-containing protein [Desulfobacula sp.]|jgi:cupin superfamily acireductone dioxygenase involved in methionine salvage|uniref:cupin domain-containing protein n=1 Tax=Desulfobacula sp. TaxID=2593537 RepID=UPI001DC8A1F7|nr:cupin domain-containing protein [Desulfobacula sp.]MBT3486852.1 cupin domain-containing protein [Desulfobacula sp.]MBT3805994.1 cupin domain-containing protein [Desulfobacula sp.]MBT4026901.1 cupin domain-containing protein [Desulfobacula sp.]MBT4200788.1 cupin domain-containing protein [Desulfobacula sp.]
MNGHIFTLIKAKDRTLDFHKHQNSDEVFYVVEGQMKLEFRDIMVHLNTGEMCVVPKGTELRPGQYSSTVRKFSKRDLFQNEKVIHVQRNEKKKKQLTIEECNTGGGFTKRTSISC